MFANPEHTSFSPGLISQKTRGNNLLYLQYSMVLLTVITDVV